MLINQHEVEMIYRIEFLNHSGVWTRVGYETKDFLEATNTYGGIVDGAHPGNLSTELTYRLVGLAVFHQSGESDNDGAFAGSIPDLAMAIKMAHTSDSIAVESHGFIDKERVMELLCAAFEGGSNYWYSGAEAIKQPEKFVTGWHWTECYPPYGGKIQITDDSGQPRVIGFNQVVNGLKKMADEYPAAWADVLQENIDAETGDVFLQCCVFGEVVLS